MINNEWESQALWIGAGGLQGRCRPPWAGGSLQARFGGSPQGQFRSALYLATSCPRWQAIAVMVSFRDTGRIWWTCWELQAPPTRDLPAAEIQEGLLEEADCF